MAECAVNKEWWAAGNEELQMRLHQCETTGLSGIDLSDTTELHW